MVIPFSFTFKSPALRVCLISFKVIQILNSAVSGEMLQAVFNFQNSVKITYVRHFLISSVYYKCSYKLWFFLSWTLNSPNLCIKWATMWYSECQNKKLDFCILNNHKDFYRCIKWAIMWYPDCKNKKIQFAHAQ